MAFYSGINGVLYFGTGNSATAGGCSAKVKNWQWTTTQEVLDTTSLCDTDRTIVPSTRSTTGSCSLHYYGANSSASQLITRIVKTGSGLGDGDNAASDQVTFKLEVEGRSITIPAYITSASMTCAVGEVVSVDISFESNGAAINNSL
jgi:hypothetical protein